MMYGFKDRERRCYQSNFYKISSAFEDQTRDEEGKCRIRVMPIEVEMEELFSLKRSWPQEVETENLLWLAETCIQKLTAKVQEMTMNVQELSKTNEELRGTIPNDWQS